MKIGYDKSFIHNTIEVPIPRLTPQIESLSTFTQGQQSTFVLDYIHYSVVMNSQTKQPIVTAFNIDQSKYKKTERKNNWKRDSRLLDTDQLNDSYYKYNDWDKGHMVMRHNTAWGNTQYEAQMADEESFYYTNAAFQHKNINRDEWLALEENVERYFSEDSNNKLCVFSGPIHNDLDRYYSRTWHDTVRIPSGFFKVICYQAKDTAKINPNGLGVKAFMMFQDDEMIKDMQGHKSIKFKEYQVTIREIEELTGLDFGEAIYESNPLFYDETVDRRTSHNVSDFPERIPIDHPDNIVDHDECRISTGHYNLRKLVIISALVNPQGRDHGKEWVSIMNCSDKTIDLDGMIMFDNKNRGLELSGKILPGQSRKFGPKKLSPIQLTNSGGDLRIVSPDMKIMDYVRWTKEDVQKAGEGRALVFGYVL